MSVTLSLIIFIIGLPVALLTAAAVPGRRSSTAATPRCCSAHRCGGATAITRGRFLSGCGDLARPADLARLRWMVVLHSIVGFVFGVVAVSLVG